jgi:hypothetical protein
VDLIKELGEIKALIPLVEPTVKNYKELARIPKLTLRPKNMPFKATPFKAIVLSLTFTQTKSGAGTPPLKQ